MGFIFDSTAVPKAMINDLFSAFARLPQRVIFKYDIQEDLLPTPEGKYGSKSGLSVPSNVLVLPWVPQQAILAHPNTRVFITHCGMHGVLEAIYHEVGHCQLTSDQVPMVGMPVFIDQMDVVKRMEETGIGLRVSKEAPGDEILSAIEQVSHHPTIGGYYPMVVKT